MKELLYIPSGKYFRFYGSYDEDIPTVSIENYCLYNTVRKNITLEDMISLIMNKNYFVIDLYCYAEMIGNSFEREEFELVEVGDGKREAAEGTLQTQIA